MRRFLPLLVFTVLLTVLITAVTLAQDKNGTDPVIIDSRLLDPSVLPGAMIDGAADPLPARNSMAGILALTADAPADSCEDAPDLSLTPDNRLRCA